MHTLQQIYRRSKKREIGDRVLISLNHLLFWRGYKPQFTQEVFEIVAFPSKKSPTYTKKDEQDESIWGKFYQNELIKNIQQWNRLQ